MVHNFLQHNIYTEIIILYFLINIIMYIFFFFFYKITSTVLGFRVENLRGRYEDFLVNGRQRRSTEPGPKSKQINRFTIPIFEENEF